MVTDDASEGTIEKQHEVRTRTQGGTRYRSSRVLGAQTHFGSPLRPLLANDLL